MALALLHSHGLFHAHVTPARIMFGSPGRNEAGAATARLCYLEKPVTPGDTWQAGEPRSAGIEKDLRYDITYCCTEIHARGDDFGGLEFCLVAGLCCGFCCELACSRGGGGLRVGCMHAR